MKYSCESGVPTDEIEQTSTANSGLTYNASTGLYTYNWKTQKNVTGCFRLELRLDDGSVQSRTSSSADPALTDLSERHSGAKIAFQSTFMLTTVHPR